MKRKITTSRDLTYQRETISLEEANRLIEQYDGKELAEYKKLYHSCSEFIPYLLIDGQVLVFNPGPQEGYLYSFWLKINFGA